MPKKGRPVFLQWFYRKMTSGFPKNDHLSDPFRTLLGVHFTYVPVLKDTALISQVFRFYLHVRGPEYLRKALNHVKQNSLKCQLKQRSLLPGG